VELAWLQFVNRSDRALSADRARRQAAISFRSLRLPLADGARANFPACFLNQREGRPTMKEPLTARLIYRPIRPLFPAGFLDRCQIQSFRLG